MLYSLYPPKFGGQGVFYDMENNTKNILRLAVPASVENILQALVGFADTWMIARIGLVAVTGVGLANNILAVYLAVFLALGVGASSLIARGIGAGTRENVKTHAAQALLLGAATGLIFGAATLAAGPALLAAMGAEGEVLAAARIYFYVVGAASVFLSLLTVSGSILRATGDTKTPMTVNTAVNFINIGVDYLLIFGIGPFPALGVLGTAIGTVIARALGCLWMLRAVQRSEAAVTRNDIRKEGVGRLVSLSVPAALERLVMRMGQVVYFSLIVTIGVTTYAAHTIAGNIESFMYMPGYGLATAAGILCGNAFGSENRRAAYETGIRAVRIGLLVMILGGVVLFFGAPLFARIFTGEAEAVAKIITALRIDAFAQLPLAVSLILTGALQGIGDMKTPLVSTAIGMWGVRVIGVYLLGLVLGLDIAGIWLAILIDLTLRAIVLSIRFRQQTAGSDAGIHAQKSL